MIITQEEIAHWKSWAGRTEIRDERLDTEASRRFAAAIGENLAVERHPPSLGHWAFFLPVVSASELGVDGHPQRGGLLPPVTLPRRMFAAAEIRFHAPLKLDAMATRTSQVRDVAHKLGGSGDLILVQVEHRIAQDGALCISELQTLIYRDTSAATAAVVPSAQKDSSGDVLWTPRTTDLFRFSAATFNGHRIHYDLPYAMDEEAYPGLVVHGPFIAARLFGHAARHGKPSAFSFRAIAPIFAGQAIRLREGPERGGCDAIRCDGVTAMQAKAEF